ncbi:uncharacterized protein LOC122653920 [Telopea speciosissima]|uniref:uncharacterized protein LOC122653920 n=1 Tax=Telopea speciosissima TaxID=54955 RepID=UPI001CC6FC19|nr:uncharacterized protein LOC122653920 [Telopea speciosissima]
MSGVTLAVAPRTDVDDQTTTSTADPTKPPPSRVHQHQHQHQHQWGVMGSLRVIELQLVCFIMVFSASGLVPLFDLVFPAFISAYLLALSSWVFPSRHHDGQGKRTMVGESSEIIKGSGLFRLYVVVGTTVGLFLPLAYVLGGFARGDDHAVRSATPHLFLLSFQILTENIISGLSLFSPPVRALVPLLYTTRRIFVIIDWIYDVWFNKRLPANAELKDVVWFWFGKVLAAANFVYFSINLFGFLIPRFLPKAFESYFRERDEIHFKIAEDKRSSAPYNVSSYQTASAKKSN